MHNTTAMDLMNANRSGNEILEVPKCRKKLEKTLIFQASFVAENSEIEPLTA